MHFDQLRRRQFITLLGSVAIWPLTARAQQTSMPEIGWLNAAGPKDNPQYLPAFRQGLAETGYVEGKNVSIEYRWAYNQFDHLPALAADLVRRHVAVIAATGGPPAAVAAKAATTTIPIVFTSGADPIAAALVPNLNRPGSNVTGMSLFYAELGAKRLELLRDLMPKLGVIAFLVNSNFVEGQSQLKDVLTAAGAIGLQISVLSAGTESEIDASFASLAPRQVGGLLVASDPFLFSRRVQIVALATRHALPAVYANRAFAAAGGLMSYEPDVSDMYRRAGSYVGRILKGANAGDLPVQQPTKFGLVINLRTAKALGLTVPDKLLALADEVIE
jgi:putative ABC transport system substrate-binding protein